MGNRESFANRLKNAVGCLGEFTNTTNPQKSRYRLKKHNSTKRDHMGVIGYVLTGGDSPRGRGYFKISSYKDLADQAGINDYDGMRIDGMHKGRDAIYLHIKNGSNGSDFKKAVQGLETIMRQVK